MANAVAAISLTRRRKLFWPVTLIAIGLLIVGWVAMSRPWEPKPILVKTETLAEGPAARILAVNGRVVPGARIDVRSTVSGQVKQLAAAEGDVVAEGAIIATIDDAGQRAAVEQTAAALDSALARQSQAQLDVDRATQLGDTISRKQAEEAKLALETAAREVERLQAARDQAAAKLDEYTIRAPFAGTVLTRGVDPGQVIDSSSFIFEIADLKTLKVEATVDELYAAEVATGLKVKLAPTGFSRVLESSLEFVAPTVNSATGGRLVRIPLSAEDGLNLPVGLTVITNIEVEARPMALTVPRAAILTGDQGSYVYVLSGTGAEARSISFIDWPAERLIVTEGLAAGDVVVLEPGKVKPKALIKSAS
jgi:RND family efflux transporter MFP subunit